MPGVQRLEKGKCVKVLEHEFAEPKQHASALAAVGARPDARFESAIRSTNGEVDIRCPGRADGGDQAAVAWGNRVERRAVKGRSKLPVDE